MFNALRNIKAEKTSKLFYIPAFGLVGYYLPLICLLLVFKIPKTSKLMKVAIQLTLVNPSVLRKTQRGI